MDCYLIKTANWVRDLYLQGAIRRVTADPHDEIFPDGSGENNEEIELQRSVVKGTAHMCFILSAGFEASGGE